MWDFAQTATRCSSDWPVKISFALLGPVSLLPLPALSASMQWWGSQRSGEHPVVYRLKLRWKLEILEGQSENGMN